MRHECLLANRHKLYIDIYHYMLERSLMQEWFFWWFKMHWGEGYIWWDKDGGQVKSKKCWSEQQFSINEIIRELCISCECIQGSYWAQKKKPRNKDWSEENTWDWHNGVWKKDGELQELDSLHQARKVKMAIIEAHLRGLQKHVFNFEIWDGEWLRCRDRVGLENKSADCEESKKYSSKLHPSQTGELLQMVQWVSAHFQVVVQN